MNNSDRFFSNSDCEYFPCHEGIEEFNCLFCFCPLYHLEECPGNPSFKEKDGKMIKVCTACIYPHKPENYDAIIELIRNSD